MDDKTVNNNALEESPKSNSNKIIIGIFGGIVLIIMLCCCGLLGYGMYYNSTPEGQADATARAQESESTSEAISIEETDTAKTATEQALPTNTALPTETPQPTNTPIATNTSQPTDTPEPTSTSQPTNTPSPTDTPEPTSQGLTSEEEQYRDAVIQISDLYSLGLTSIGELSTRASNDITLFIDDDWRNDMALALAIMQVAGDQVRELDPPDIFIPTHTFFLEAANHYDKATILLAEGIDELDADKLTEATEEMELGNISIQLATDAIPSFEE